ncbi:unnamed protein product [Rotaria sordida]|uniref:Nose resistant-to-fluoxetine protein N-terminal domain-containing protein n=1 Tax=Rotaria sordida TaxID=392033 RepID=A0A815CV58_9BILA|nr:unnamed protein product [Rotaria sordida]CAF3697683.1 unnamed protein product [Rotaria sordida]
MNIKAENQSPVSPDRKQARAMVSTCRPDGDRYCYLTEALELILLGERTNRTDIQTLLNTIHDNETLDWMLVLGIQQLILFGLGNPTLVPDDFSNITSDLYRLIQNLAVNGSTGVFWKDLKPYIIRFANRPTAIKLLGFLFYDAPKNAKTYINDIYLQDVKDKNCKRALGLWFDSITDPIRNLWALRLFDASGKPPANLLAANTNWLGNWNSCHKVKYSNESSSFRFQGRYCRAKVRAQPSLLALAGGSLEGFPGNPEELAAIDLGLCVPDFCGNEDIASVVNNTVRLLTIHQLTNIRHVDDVLCESSAKLNAAYYVTLVLITILTVIVILATLYDCFFRTILNKPYATISTLSLQNIRTLCNLTPSDERPHGIFYKALNAYHYQFSNRLQLHGISYSSEVDRTNVLQSRKDWYNSIIYKFHRIAIELSAYTAILKPMSNTGAMKCLNGIRVLSMLWIIWGHTYNYIGDQSYFLLTQNALDLLDLQKTRVDAQIIINALYGVDTFFLISAMLVTLSLMRMLKKNGMPKWYFWPLMYLERYLRLIPPYIMIFLLYIYVVPYIGRGPLWTTENFPMKNADCHDYWWAYFLLVNNFVPGGKGTRCLGYYWYVSNDFQLFLIAPFLIVPLYYFPVIGSFMLIGILAASSCILGFNIANTYRVGHILPTLQAIWEDTYIKPYCRAGPYVIGIVLGYIFFKTDKKKIHLHPLLHLFYWSLTIAFMATSIFGNWRNHEEGAVPMPPNVYVLYFVLSRIAWPLAIAWIIFSCYKGLAPLIDSILSWRGFTFFAYTSYTTYLIHPMIMVYYMFAQQNLFHATDITLLYLFFGHLVFALLLGFVAHLVFERTFGVLIGLILPKRQR